MNQLHISHLKLRSTIHQKLIESGEKERLKMLLRSKLIETGWRDEVKANCRDYVKSNGAENLSLDDLIKHMTGDARKKVPPQLKIDLVKRIRKFCAPNTAASNNPTLPHLQ